MKMTKQLKAGIKQFSTRFSYEDWQMLNTKIEFLDAIEAGEFEVAAVVAHRVLTGQD